jgi:insulysin
VETDVRLDLLCQLLDRALFEQLRTVERLGYVVSASAPRKWGACGLRCVVQSTLPPALLDSRVDACLRAFGARLAAMPEEEVAAAAGSLRTARLERDRAVDALCSRLMAEVCSHDYAFDRREQEAAALARLRRADLVDFFQQYIAPDSPTRSRRRPPLHPFVRSATFPTSRAHVRPSTGRRYGQSYQLSLFG